MFPTLSVAYISCHKQVLSKYLANRILMLPENHNRVVTYFALKIQMEKLKELFDKMVT